MTKKFCLDNTFVSDYLAGKQYTKRFLQNHSSNSEFYVPSLVRYEAYVPAFQTGGTRNLKKSQNALKSFKDQSFEDREAIIAAEIRAHLIDGGQKIGAPDVLIAGVAKCLGATVVTDNKKHFERVPGLNVIKPPRK
ncbi:PIN domain-containing protein [Halorubrum sp. AD140]|uniref:PIN domain-containing protein n=1 Tax=Halorubrum sp. AD140 TaxID=3050073 RepID=UPI002ACCB48B|nr:PIN domain-containing protein [Halorubrum sp. AD140]MDZ5810072.1 PIN domain-containing protein [Halorubrum sp. AD140]